LKATANQAKEGTPSANPNGVTPPTAPTNTESTQKTRIRTSALNTYLVTSLLKALVSILNDTKSNVERRFSLTAREREQELMEQARAKPVVKAEAGEEEEEEEERIYNPLKLPLGWDGKPIPYWLYKLHGLGVEYRCEICSDHVYMGRFVAQTLRFLFAI
jgi:splicing factor 3A subunit 3